MKHVKLASVLLVLTLLFSVISATPVFAANTASLTGPSTVRAGDTITLTFTANGSNIVGLEGEFSYDSNQVTLSSFKQKIGSAWTVSNNGNKFSGYDIQQNSPINKSTAVFTATFKVKSNVATGTKITISVKDVILTDVNAGTNVGTKSYTATIAAPKSTDATLKSLTVKNATISPAFSKDTTKYTASVDYSVSKLDISAVANDSKADVSVSGNSLKVGSNTVKVTVTAENGDTKTYSITVTRAQDPNYVPSNNADLKSISVSQGILSPAFKADQTEYIVYLPYEVTKFNANGAVSDSKASVAGSGDVALEVGENKATVTVTAEDGSKKEYNITVMRMQQLGADVPIATPTQEPTPTPDATTPTTEAPTTTAPATKAPTATNAGGSDQSTEDHNCLPVGIWIVLLIVAFALGLGTGILVMKKKK